MKDLTMEELMDLAEEALDRIERGEEWADAHVWMSVLGFVQRVNRMSEESTKETWMSEIADKLKRRVALTIARMDRSNMIVASAREGRMPEALDDIATLYDGTHDELMHDVMRAVRRGLTTGDLQQHDVVEYLAAHLPPDLCSRVVRYYEILESIGDDRH